MARTKRAPSIRDVARAGDRLEQHVQEGRTDAGANVATIYARRCWSSGRRAAPKQTVPFRSGGGKPLRNRTHSTRRPQTWGGSSASRLDTSVSVGY